MNKRGQVVIFIIIGIIILIAIISIFVIRSYIVEREIEVVRPVIEELPTEFEPIRVFTENWREIAFFGMGTSPLVRINACSTDKSGPGRLETRKSRHLPHNSGGRISPLGSRQGDKIWIRSFTK